MMSYTINISNRRGAERSGPCIMGGVSPSLHPAPQSITETLFTRAPLTTSAFSRFGFHEPKNALVVVALSSGPSQSLDKTKAFCSSPLRSNQIARLS